MRRYKKHIYKRYSDKKTQKRTIPNDLQPDPKSDIFEETFSLQISFCDLIKKFYNKISKKE